MKIRSKQELNDYLDKELGWRKKELTTLRFMLRPMRRHQRNALLRAAVCILYAHWEGFVKAAATGYVCLVANYGFLYSELTPNMIALGLRSDFKRAGNSNRATDHTNFISYVMSGLSGKASIHWDTAINTESNLNIRILEDILCILGLDATPYIMKKAIIDERLLANRNNIAHGKYLEISEEDYDDLHTEVIVLIERFRNDVENAITSENYRKK